MILLSVCGCIYTSSNVWNIWNLLTRAVCSWISTSECFGICYWWPLLWGIRLHICCLLDGNYVTHWLRTLKNFVWLIFSSIISLCHLLPFSPFLTSCFWLLLWVDAHWTSFFNFPAGSCSSTWTSWSLDSIVFLHDFACSSWSMAVISNYVSNSFLWW